MQVFIFTHNFAFFREVKNWFKFLKKKNKQKGNTARFYQLHLYHVQNTRNSVIEKLDPLLKDYESEYHYLFKIILDASKTTIDDGGLSQYCSIPNVVRRLLEAFLAFKYPGKGTLRSKLNGLDFDKEKQIRIDRLLNTLSHKGQIDEPEHDLSLLSETPRVLSDVLELIQYEDKQHYDGMMELLSE
jgi:wobble nucleotide-excising tRNase